MDAEYRADDGDRPRWCHSLYVDPNGIMVEMCRDTPGITPNPELVRELLHSEELHSGVKVHK